MINIIFTTQWAGPRGIFQALSVFASLQLFSEQPNEYVSCLEPKNISKHLFCVYIFKNIGSLNEFLRCATQRILTEKQFLYIEIQFTITVRIFIWLEIRSPRLLFLGLDCQRFRKIWQNYIVELLLLFSKSVHRTPNLKILARTLTVKLNT